MKTSPLPFLFLLPNPIIIDGVNIFNPEEMRKMSFIYRGERLFPRSSLKEGYLLLTLLCKLYNKVILPEAVINEFSKDLDLNCIEGY